MIWRDGQLIDDDCPVLHASDRGVLLGDGLFETIKVSKGRALFLAKHMARMQVAGSEMGLRINRQALRQGVQDLLTAQGASEGALRITVTRGPGPRGLSPIPQPDQQPVSMIAFHAAGPEAPPQEHPDRLVSAPFVRPAGALSSRHKTLSYADNLAAMAYAREERAADALFFNERGEVACTTMANIFIRTGIGYMTPPLSAGILPGIVRSVLLDEAAAGGVNIEIRPLTADDLRDRLLFRTNSLLGVRPAWYDDRTSTLRPAIDEDEGMLDGLYRLAERREEGA
ncbi:MAG: aminotransferase class IV [Pseudomonadota bacterium]